MMNIPRQPEHTHELGLDLTICYYRFTQVERQAEDRSVLAGQLATIHHARAFPGSIAIQYLADPDPVTSWLRQADVVHLMALRHRSEGII